MSIGTMASHKPRLIPLKTPVSFRWTVPLICTVILFKKLQHLIRSGIRVAMLLCCIRPPRGIGPPSWMQFPISRKHEGFRLPNHKPWVVTRVYTVIVSIKGNEDYSILPIPTLLKSGSWFLYLLNTVQHWLGISGLILLYYRVMKIIYSTV
jgi:hypothetical protein